MLFFTAGKRPQTEGHVHSASAYLRPSMRPVTSDVMDLYATKWPQMSQRDGFRGPRGKATAPAASKTFHRCMCSGARSEHREMFLAAPMIPHSSVAPLHAPTTVCHPGEISIKPHRQPAALLYTTPKCLCEPSLRLINSTLMCNKVTSPAHQGRSWKKGLNMTHWYRSSLHAYDARCT